MAELDAFSFCCVSKLVKQEECVSMAKLLLPSHHQAQVSDVVV